VAANRLSLDGQIALGEAARQHLVLQLDGRGLLPSVKPGDDVAVHWGWACEVLAAAPLGRLKAWTARSLHLANLTI